MKILFILLCILTTFGFCSCTDSFTGTSPKDETQSTASSSGNVKSEVMEFAQALELIMYSYPDDENIWNIDENIYYIAEGKDCNTLNVIVKDGSNQTKLCDNVGDGNVINNGKHFYYVRGNDRDRTPSLYSYNIESKQEEILLESIAGFYIIGITDEYLLLIIDDDEGSDSSSVITLSLVDKSVNKVAKIPEDYDMIASNVINNISYYAFAGFDSDYGTAMYEMPDRYDVKQIDTFTSIGLLCPKSEFAGYYYYLDYADEDEENGNICRVAVTGGVPEVLSTVSGADRVIASAGKLFFSSDEKDGIRMYDINSGKMSDILDESYNAYTFSDNNTLVCVTASNEVKEISIP